MNIQPTNLDKILSSESFQDDTIALSRGWVVPTHFIINTAIVIGVKTGVSFNPTYSASIPQFSVNARILGKNNDSVEPEFDIPDWYPPFLSNSIISVPEIGELVTIIREATSSDSRGYWVGRVNDTDFVSLKLAKDHLPDLTPQEKYGFNFDTKTVHDTSRQPQADDGKKVYQLPAKLGDVLMQGRNGSFIRHSYNPSYGAFNKPGVLEMGLLEDRHYKTTGFPQVGTTKTKTIHLADSDPANLGNSLNKVNYIDNDFYFDSDAVIDTPTGPRRAGNNPIRTKRNIIANFANEIYHKSTAADAEELMHRSVLGEKLNDTLSEQDELIISIIESIKSLSDTVNILFDSYLDHTHTLPEINVDLPEKEIEFEDSINKGIELVNQPPLRVFVPAQRVAIPATGGQVIKKTIDTPVGPKVIEVRAAGTPGTTTVVPSKFITIPQPPKAVNRGYEKVIRKTKVDFEAITIGGVSNPRFTTKIETDEKTTTILKNLNELKDTFQKSQDDFVSLITKLENHLSKRNYIN